MVTDTLKGFADILSKRGSKRYEKNNGSCDVFEG